MLRHVIAPALLLAAGLALAGCSGGGEEKPDKTSEAAETTTAAQEARLQALADGEKLPSTIGPVISLECDDNRAQLLDDGTTFSISPCHRLGATTPDGMIVSTGDADELAKVLEWAKENNDRLEVSKSDTAAYLGAYTEAKDVAEQLGWTMVTSEPR